MASAICEWLELLELGQYGPVFEANDIDLDVVPELTDTDLRELGVSLGHRKRILRAASNLAGEEARSVDSNPEGSPGPEFRYLTVMFCDLVGSTAMTGELGAERMREVNRAFQTSCQNAVERFAGHVARYMGDGLLVYFGFPTAQEDAAERAVRAGFAVITSLRKLDRQLGRSIDIKLTVRVGIATGRVVVENIGSGASQEDAVVGDAPNLAARLQALARPNTIMISASTRDRTADLFAYRDHGDTEIPGIAEPIRLWEVLGESEVEGRFRAMRGSVLGDFFGRREELDLLYSRWCQARDGDGQVVLLTAEAGLGKSRVIEVLFERVAADHCVPFRIYCAPYHANSALYPLTERIRREAQIAADAPPEAHRQHLEALLIDKYRFSPDAVSAFASLISEDLDERYPSSGRSPRERLATLIDALVSFLVNMSRDQPIMVVVEDAHWIDPSTADLLTRLVGQLETEHLCLLISARDGGAPHYDSTHVTHLSLNRLGRAQVEQIIGSMCRDQSLDGRTVRLIHDKSDGIPLYVEEITKMVLESRSHGPTRAGASGDARLHVPDSLQASLLARLDQLGNVKQSAQMAAVVGAPVSPDLMHVIAEIDLGTAKEHLLALVDHNVLLERRSPAGSRFEFRHALLRDAAYESLLESRRVAIHGRIARALSNPNAIDAKHDPATIAHHYMQARKLERAFGFWLEAGQSAYDAGATAEAVELLDRAIGCAPSSPASNQQLRAMLQLHMARGKALNARFGAGSEEANRCFRQAAEVSKRLGDIGLEVDALDHEFGIKFNAGMLRDALEPAIRMRDIGIEEEAKVALISGHQALGMAYFNLGELDSARLNLDASLRHRDEPDTGVNCYPSMSLTYLSFVLFVKGEHETAREHCLASVRSARAESAYSTATALSNGCYTMEFLGEIDTVERYAEELVELAVQKGQYMYRNRGLFFRHWVRAGRSHDEESLRKLVELTSTLLELHEEVEITYLLGLTGGLQTQYGQHDAAEETLEKALQTAAKNDEQFYTAELLRSKASLCQARGEPGDVETAARLLNEAIELAQRQGAKSWEDNARAAAGSVDSFV